MADFAPSAPTSAGGPDQAFAGYSEQFDPAPLWVVNHNLGRHPLSWAIENTGGVEIDVSVQHVSPNQSIVYFDTPTAGVAKFT